MLAMEMLAEATRAGGIARGTVESVGEDAVIVRVADAGGARSVPCEVLHGAGGAPVLAAGARVLVWLDQPGHRGVVLGAVGAPSAVAAARPAADGVAAAGVPDELVVEARSGLTLRCGDGSITIRADGRILIKGKDLVSHARRVNRIKGGSVAIN